MLLLFKAILNYNVELKWYSGLNVIKNEMLWRIHYINVEFNLEKYYRPVIKSITTLTISITHEIVSTK